MLQRMRGAKDQNPARADGDLLAGLRVAPDALAFMPHREASGRGNLDDVTLFQRPRDLRNHRFDEFGGFAARKPDLLIDRLGELSAGNRMTGHNALPAFT